MFNDPMTNHLALVIGGLVIGHCKIDGFAVRAKSDRDS